MGANPCLWCRMVGYHDQTPEERSTLIKQASIGILVMTILLVVVGGAIIMLIRLLTR